MRYSGSGEVGHDLHKKEAYQRTENAAEKAGAGTVFGQNGINDSHGCVVSFSTNFFSSVDIMVCCGIMKSQVNRRPQAGDRDIFY